MDLRQIRQFVTVADTLHFGRAAERLGMTQPPLSQSVRALEEEIGVALFTRTKRHVALTAVGAQWLPYARHLLADAGALPGIAERLSRGEIGAVRLAFISTADYNVLPLLVSKLKQVAPEVEVTLREATSDVQIEALLDGEIDAGVIIPPPEMANLAALDYQPLQREPLVAALPEVWVESGRIALTGGHVDFARIADAPLILFPRRGAPAFHDLVTRYFAEQGRQPRLGQQAIQMQTIISLVSVGMGVALVPASMRNLARAGVRYVPLAGAAPEIETGIAWRRNNTMPTLGQLLEVARELAEDGE